MAYIQHLIFDDEKLPLTDSCDIDLSAIEADSSDETEAGTTQRDVVRTGVVTISVLFSVSPKSEPCSDLRPWLGDQSNCE